MNNKILWEYFVFLTTTVCVEQTRTSYERPFDISSISRSLHIQSLSVDVWEVFAVKATSMLAWPLIFMLSLVGAFKEQLQKISSFLHICP